MGEPHLPLRRVLLPWVTGATLLVMTLIAVFRVLNWRDVAIERERARLQGAVEDAIEAWEDRLVDDLTEQLELAALDPNLASDS